MDNKDRTILELLQHDADMPLADIAAYDSVYKRLIKIADLHAVSSSFAMEQLKYTTALPLDYMR